jgi:hypothetical protein
VEFTVASKNTQPFYKNSRDSRVSNQFSNEPIDTYNVAHDVTLRKNINRLSHNTKNTITISLILQYLGLFMGKRIKKILLLSVIMAGIYCAINLGTSYALRNMVSVNPIILNVASKGILLLTGLIIGMSILRAALLSRKERNNISFFHGFMSFAGLHIVMNVLIAIMTVINTIIFDSILNSVIASLLSITIIAFLSSAFLTRFSFLIPSIICQNEDSWQIISSQIASFLKPLFLILFCTKFLCLNVIFFSDMFLTDIAGMVAMANMADMVLLAPKAVIFVFYHIFVYSLLGVSFKLYNKFS